MTFLQLLLRRSRGRPRIIRSWRLAFGLAAALLMVLSVVPVAYAAAPSNDDSVNATNLTSFPVITTADLTDATIESGEPWCGNHVASVWYRYVAPAEETLTVSVSASEPDTRVCVLRDAISAGTYRFIQPSETVQILLDGGHAYYILLGVLSGATNATLYLDVGPPTFDLTVTVDPTGIADKISGAAIVGGTLTCSDSSTVDLFVRVSEKVTSKRVADGTDYRLRVPCGTTTARWQMRIYGSWAYVPGPAVVSIQAYSEDFDDFTTTIKLGAK